MENLDNPIFPSRTDLIVVDSNIAGHQDLISNINSSADIIILNGERDGITQISEALEDYEEVDSIQIVSHGDRGSIQLGNTELNSANLEEYRDELMDWGKVLSEDGDILIFGCNVAGGEGTRFVDALSEVTGADVAASTGLTGNSALGGDGDLEYATGAIESTSVISSDALSSFEGVFVNEYIADTDPNFQNDRLLTNLDEPIALESLPDGRLLILLKGGEIKITNPSATVPVASDYLTIPDVDEGGERGLLDIALDPDFASNNYFYVYYSQDSSKEFRISRFTHQGDTASNEQVIWTNPNPQGAFNSAHHGGGLDFGADGTLYLSIGEQFDEDAAQDLTSTRGKVIRINKDGTIPADNPFVDGPGGNLDEIWAYGLRNPWRLSSDNQTGRIFISEVGGNDDRAREDIHLGEIGANYGWDGRELQGFTGLPGVSDPIFTYDHSESPTNSGAVSGGLVFRGNGLPSEFNGSYFFGDYAQRWIRYLKFDANGEVIDAEPETPNTVEAFNFTQNAGSVVAFEEGVDGELYYLDIYQNPSERGALRRVSFSGSDNQAPEIVTASADVVSGSSPLTVNFTSSATDPENDSLTYLWDFGDGSPQVTGASVTHTFDSRGSYDATLVVSDTENNSTTIEEPIEITVGSRPDATITSPIDGDLFRAGDTITLTGSATDADSVLTEDNYSWEVRFLHDTHFHPEENDLIGSGQSFEIDTTGHLFTGDTGFEVLLTVTDVDGLSETESVVIRPEKVDLTFESNIPGGVNFTLDGSVQSGAFTVDTAINFEHEIIFPEIVNSGGLEYTFDSWSDGVITPSRSLTVPDANQTYRANYIVTGESTGSGQLPVTEGLALQLDAAVGVNANQNGVISSWADQSGNGNDLSGLGDPTLVAGGLNGNNVIRFDGDGDRLERIGGVSELPAGNADRTVYVVAKYNSTGYGGFAYGRNFTRNAFGLIVAGDGDLLVQAWGGIDADSNVDGTGAGWLAQSAVLEGGNLAHYKDGELIDSRTNNNYNTTLDRIVLGAEIDGSPFMDMEVAEILVYDRALSQEERTQVDSYIQQRYFGSGSNGGGNPGGENPNQAPTAINDAVTTEVDTVLNGNVLNDNGNGADSDSDGDSLTVTQVNAVAADIDREITLASGALLTINSDGSFSYDPNSQFTLTAGETATDSFDYTIGDGNGGTDTATVTITISDANVSSGGDSQGSNSDLPVTEGLALQLDAAVGVNANQNGVISSWADQSGNGNDLSGLGDPTLVAGGLNGNNVIRFDGDGDRLERIGGVSELPAGNADRTVYVVAKYNSTGYGGFAYGRNFTRNAFGLIVAGDGDLLVQAWGGIDADSNVDGTGAGWLAQSAVLEGGNLAHYKDGELIDSRTNNNYNTTLDRIVLGAEIDGSPFMDMEVAEILVYDRALSQEERTQVDSYIQQRYFGSGSNGGGNPGGENPNQAPTAINDAVTTEVDTVLNGNVLNDNGNGADSDSDGDSLTVTQVNAVAADIDREITLASGALLTINSDGSFSYDPNSQFTLTAGETATDSFDYTIGDGNGGTDTATVTIAISANAPEVVTGAIDFSNYTFESGEGSTRALRVFDSTSGGELDGVNFVFDSTPVGEDAHFHIPGRPEYLTQHNAAGNGPQIGFTLAREDGEAFAFESFEYTSGLFFGSDVNDGFTVTGTVSGGGTVTQAFGAAETLETFQTAVLNDPDWNNVTSVSFVGDRIEPSGDPSAEPTQELNIDNIVVGLASEPPTPGGNSDLPVTDGLALQLDAAAGVTTDDNGVISSWADQSGNGNDLTGLGDPTLVAGELNGNNVVRFDGDGDRLERIGGVSQLPSGNADRTVFVVAKYNSKGYGGFAYGRNFTRNAFGLIVGGDGDLLVQAWGGIDADSNVDGTGAGWLSQSAVLEGGNLTHYKDGELIDSRTNTYNTTLDRIILGAEIDGSPFMDMEVAEILVYDRALSQSERTQVDSYIQQRYFNATSGN